MKKINELELKEIFEKIKLDDKSGIEELYEKYHYIVYGVAFSILKNKDNSEDVVQNVFAKIMKLDKSQFPSQGEASWLYTVSKNETIQFLRKQKQIVDIDDLFSLESESDEISDIMDMDSYYKLLENLKPIDKEIISLRILSDFTFDKIAQMLNMPIGTVEWRYYKSLHYIKLSITNLAALVIVFAVWKSSQESKNVEYDSTEKGETSESESSTLPDKSPFSGTQSLLEMAADTAGTTSMSNTINVKDTKFSIICIILIISTLFFAFKKKLKKTKK